MPRRIGSAGYSLVDLSETEYFQKVVSLLRWSGLPIQREQNVQYGGGGYMQSGRWLLDGDGGGGGASGEDARTSVSMGDGFGGGHVGYALIDSAWLRVYPLVGIGGAGSGYAVAPKTGDEPTYAYTVVPVLLLGIGIELRLPISRRFSPMVGVRVGYRYALKAYENKGTASADTLTLPPKARGGFFFRLLMGAGVQMK